MTKNDHLGQSHVIGDAEDLVIAGQIFIKISSCYFNFDHGYCVTIVDGVQFQCR
jgi:hypothetical protein